MKSWGMRAHHASSIVAAAPPTSTAVDVSIGVAIQLVDQVPRMAPAL
jgi:hypothetical protein